MLWFNKIVEDIANIAPAIDYYNKQIKDARPETSIKGNLEKLSAALPGQIEYRFYQLQDLEAILEHLHIKVRKERSKVLRNFMENYNRELSAREAEKWVDGEEDVVTLQELVNEIALLRNQFLGIMKGLEVKGFQINNIVKLRVAGIEDTEIGIFK